MKKPIEVILRARIVDIDPILALLEKTEDIAILSKRCACRKYTIRGVPAKKIDVLVSLDALSPMDARDTLIIEISHKQGRYDGNWRKRITLRRLPGHQAKHLPLVSPVISTIESDQLTIAIGQWADTFQTLRSSLDGYHLPRILMWHWRRYYPHLHDTDAVCELANSWAEEISQEIKEKHWTLAEANRSASRALYRFSREMGWRKLTLREREKLGFSVQWVTEEQVTKRYIELGMAEHASGCGEYTLNSAKG